jgi:hypothetical protein
MKWAIRIFFVIGFLVFGMGLGFTTKSQAQIMGGYRCPTPANWVCTGNTFGDCVFNTGLVPTCEFADNSCDNSACIKCWRCRGMTVGTGAPCFVDNDGCR